MWAVIQVLDGKRKPMTSNEILAEITDRRLAKKLNGKTPEASVRRPPRRPRRQGLLRRAPREGQVPAQKGRDGQVDRQRQLRREAGRQHPREGRRLEEPRTARVQSRRQSPQSQQQQPADAGSIPAPAEAAPSA